MKKKITRSVALAAVCLVTVAGAQQAAQQETAPQGPPPGAPPGMLLGAPPGMPPGAPPGMPPGGPPGGMPFMPSTADTEYTAAIYVEDGRYDADRSVAEHVTSGSVDDSFAEDVQISADGEDFNGVFVRGAKSNFSLSDATIRLNGDGSNDFLGLGAGVMAEGGATVIVRNTDIVMNGVVAAATISTGNAVMRVYDSTLRSNGGELPEDFVPVIGPGMKTPPAPLGITGTARTNVTMGNARSYFYNSTIIAEGWGALSTDACGGDVYLEANNSDIIVNNSGYGLYSDNGCRVVFNDSTINSATYGGILAGVGYITLNNVETEAAKNVLMIHSVFGRPTESGSVAIRGGSHRSGEAIVLVKSANLSIGIDGATLDPGDGNLIHSIVNDDANRTRVDGAETPGINVTLSNMTVSGDIRHEDTADRNMVVSLVDTQLTGAVINAEINLDADSSWTATGDSQVRLPDSLDLHLVDALPGVTVTVLGSDEAAMVARHELPSGGNLIVPTSSARVARVAIAVGN